MTAWFADTTLKIVYPIVLNTTFLAVVAFFMAGAARILAGVGNAAVPLMGCAARWPWEREA